MYTYSLLLFVVSSVYILVVASYPDWVGGWAPPARYILVLTPLFSYYIAYVLQLFRNFIAWGLYKILMVIGFVSAFFTLYAPSFGFDVNDGINHTFLYLEDRLGIQITRIFPSVFRPNQGKKFIIWFALVVALMVFVAYSKKIIKFLESR